MANPFTYLELHSTDASRAKTFYTPVPGMGSYTEIDTQEGPGAGLMTQQEPGGRSAWLAYIKVPKLDETVSRAQKLGATVIAPRTRSRTSAGSRSSRIPAEPGSAFSRRVNDAPFGAELRVKVARSLWDGDVPRRPALTRQALRQSRKRTVSRAHGRSGNGEPWIDVVATGTSTRSPAHICPQRRARPKMYPASAVRTTCSRRGPGDESPPMIPRTRYPMPPTT
jgi:predicted enzyme related to lactoylglutathione lyase